MLILILTLFVRSWTHLGSYSASHHVLDGSLVDRTTLAQEDDLAVVVFPDLVGWLRLSRP